LHNYQLLIYQLHCIPTVKLQVQLQFLQHCN